MVITSGPSPRGASLIQALLTASNADGTGSVADVASFAAHQHVELVKTGTGTCSVTIQGSDDGNTWYPARYQQMDIEPRPAEADTALALGAGAVSHVYEILDRYPFVRTSQTLTAGAVIVNATLFAEASAAD